MSNDHPDPSPADRWFVTFGFGSNLGGCYAILGHHETQARALDEVGRHWGYTRTGAVRCAFVYPFSELNDQIIKYDLREVPLGAHLHQYEEPC